MSVRMPYEMGTSKFLVLQTDYNESEQVLVRQAYIADTLEEATNLVNELGKTDNPGDVPIKDLSLFFACDDGRSETVWITNRMAAIFHRYDNQDSGRTVFRIMED